MSRVQSTTILLIFNGSTEYYVANIDMIEHVIPDFGGGIGPACPVLTQTCYVVLDPEYATSRDATK